MAVPEGEKEGNPVRGKRVKGGGEDGLFLYARHGAPRVRPYPAGIKACLQQIPAICPLPRGNTRGERGIS